MNNTEPKSPSVPEEINGDKNNFKVPIILAIIGLIGSVAGYIFASPVLIKYIETKATSEAKTPDVSSTANVHINTTSQLEVIASSTPSLMPSLTPVPQPTATIYPPGIDWKNGCVSSAWKIFPPEAQVKLLSKGCYQEPLARTGSYFADEQKLSLLMSNPVLSAEVFGLFAQLPSSGSVHLTIDLDELENGEIWVGIFSSPDPASNGLLLLIPPGDITNRVFSLREMPHEFETYLTASFTGDNGVYLLDLYYSAGAFNFAVNQRVFNEKYPLDYSEKWLFIGYRAKIGMNQIEASFSDLIIKSGE
jgi:hypothetical protein